MITGLKRATAEGVYGLLTSITWKVRVRHSVQGFRYLLSLDQQICHSILYKYVTGSRALTLSHNIVVFRNTLQTKHPYYPRRQIAGKPY